jgi:ABC-type multidrug transport system ATPase subunit
VLFSTHILSDHERVADVLGIMDHGRLKLSTPLEDLLNTTKRVQVIFEGESTPPRFVIPNALWQQISGPVVTAVVRLAPNQSLETLRFTPGARVNVFHMGLEDILLHLLRVAPAPSPANTASTHFTETFNHLD